MWSIETSKETYTRSIPPTLETETSQLNQWLRGRRTRKEIGNMANSLITPNSRSKKSISYLARQRTQLLMAFAQKQKELN